MFNFDYLSKEVSDKIKPHSKVVTNTIQQLSLDILLTINLTLSKLSAYPLDEETFRKKEFIEFINSFSFFFLENIELQYINECKYIQDDIYLLKCLLVEIEKILDIISEEDEDANIMKPIVIEKANHVINTLQLMNVLGE